MSDRGDTPTEDDALGCYEEGTITRVDGSSSGGWSISYGDAWGCFMDDHGVVPKVGDHFRCYGRFGSTIHGQAINGVVVWYKTKAEIEAKHQKWLADHKAKQLADFEEQRDRLDADYDSLPPVLRKRIDRFRAANPDFRWESESYEMFVCTQAALLAEWAAERDEPEQAVIDWNKLAYAEQLATVPDWSDGHSGNTHACAVGLARLMLTSRERAAVAPGALTPLTGSADYSKESA